MRENPRRILHLAVILMALSMVTVACGNGDVAEPVAAVTPTTAAPDMTPGALTPTTIAEPIEIEDVSLRLDWLKGGGYHTGFYVALEKGFFEEAGFNVSIGDGQGSTSTVQLLAAGEDEFGYVAGTALVAAIAEGMPVIEVANMIPYTGLCTATLATSGLDTMASLNGRTWGGTAYGSSTAIIDVILEAGGADPEQVQKVTLDTAALSVAFMEGTIDAFDVVRFSERHGVRGGRRTYQYVLSRPTRT
jgi:NitT/TauT family transport system substrate-binding protein